MGDYTSRSGMYLPGGGSTGLILPDEVVDIDKINSNFRIIDNLLGARNIASASGYSGSMDGDLVYAQDTGFLHMYSGSEARLLTPRLPGARQYSGTQAERVAFASGAKDGDLWRDTDNIGVIWVLKAGTPNTWVYSGNKLRGDRTAMDKLVTDGMAVAGMTVFNTTDNSDYVNLGGAWTVPAGNTFSANLVSAALPSSSYLVMSNQASWSITNNLPGATWSNGIKVAEAGLYLVTFTVLIATQINLFAVVKKNDTAANSNNGVVQQYVHQNTSISPAGGSISRVVNLAAGDFLVPALYTNGSAGPYGITPSGTGFSVTKV